MMRFLSFRKLVNAPLWRIIMIRERDQGVVGDTRTHRKNSLGQCQNFVALNVAVPKRNSRRCDRIGCLAWRLTGARKAVHTLSSKSANEYDPPNHDF